MEEIRKALETIESEAGNLESHEDFIKALDLIDELKSLFKIENE